MAPWPLAHAHNVAGPHCQCESFYAPAPLSPTARSQGPRGAGAAVGRVGWSARGARGEPVRVLAGCSAAFRLPLDGEPPDLATVRHAFSPIKPDAITVPLSHRGARFSKVQHERLATPHAAAQGCCCWCVATHSSRGHVLEEILHPGPVPDWPRAPTQGYGTVSTMPCRCIHCLHSSQYSPALVVSKPRVALTKSSLAAPGNQLHSPSCDLSVCTYLLSGNPCAVPFAIASSQ
jgi:hypothetical protein